MEFYLYTAFLAATIQGRELTTRHPPAKMTARLADDSRLLVRLTVETVLKGVNTLPLFADFVGMAVLLLAESAARWREGREEHRVISAPTQISKLKTSQN